MVFQDFIVFLVMGQEAVAEIIFFSINSAVRIFASATK